VIFIHIVPVKKFYTPDCIRRWLSTVKDLRCRWYNDENKRKKNPEKYEMSFKSQALIRFTEARLVCLQVRNFI